MRDARQAVRRARREAQAELEVFSTRVVKPRRRTVPTGAAPELADLAIVKRVNGVLETTLTAQRWRILNAAEGKFVSLAVKDHQLQAIA